MTIKQKMVVLPESKVLPKNGGMYGPIDTPHMVSVEDIKIMLFYGAEVFEVFEDGKVKLTNENYDKDNSDAVMASAHQRNNIEPKDEVKPAKQSIAEEKIVKQEEVQQEQKVQTQQAPKQERRK